MTTLLRHTLVTLSFLLIGATVIFAQESLDGVITVDGTARNYSIYVPSTYNAEAPNPLMLALHPFNTTRWNSRSWRDTLVAFAETNGLILVCPDGGTDGNLLSERADTLNATALLDSVDIWYNIDKKRTYVMGFSVGGGTTYVYGIVNAWRFNGFIPIGAALPPGFTSSPVFVNVKSKPFFILNGQNDAPAIRVTPVAAALDANDAIVDSLILPGVGHTIDFNGRNDVFTNAYKWIDSVNCANAPSSVQDYETSDALQLRLYPNPIGRDRDAIVRWEAEGEIRDLRVQDLLGNVVGGELVTLIDRSSAKINTQNLPSGVYFLEVKAQDKSQTIRFIID